MSVRQRMKTSMFNLLRLFTVYDAVLQAIQRPTIGGALLLKTLLYRQRQALEILIPMAAWHVYRAKIPSASWSFSLILVVRQLLKGVDEEMILERIDAVGPVIFSLAYSLPIYAVHVLYFREVVYSTNNHFEAIAQALLFLLPDVLSVLSKAREMYGSGITRPIRNRLSLFPNGV